MIRFLNAYFPARTVVLGVSEIFLTLVAFLAATVILAGQESLLVLLYEHGMAKIVLAATVFALCMYYLDLYDTVVLSNRAEVLTGISQQDDARHSFRMLGSKIPDNADDDVGFVLTIVPIHREDLVAAVGRWIAAGTPCPRR